MKRSTPGQDFRGCFILPIIFTGITSRSLRLRPTSAQWRKRRQQQRKSYSAATYMLRTFFLMNLMEEHRMAVPVSQACTVATYVLKQKLMGRKQYPLVLMLEPLFRCNLACAGCGKIKYPSHILKAELSPEECFNASEECGAPMVSIPGGEPLLHPQMPEIVAGLVARKKYVYMCTNALLLKEKLHLFKPSKYLSFSVHVDGQREHHDFSVCREGGYNIAMEGVR